MRIAVISDTHMPRGTRALPEACVERLRAADLILHAGDVTGDIVPRRVARARAAGRGGATGTWTSRP